ncbi:MAG: hypothetical protein KJ936_10390 [Proteobacteria bacterium]|nr:hypothetical protein [Pseudomonadota bacterium]
MVELEKTKNDLISSIDILDRTGLSRATLNNYIKMGMLPRPLVRKPETSSSKAKQIGYFPPSVLDDIRRIRQYKEEGFSMDEICDHLRSESARPSKDAAADERDSHAGPIPDGERRTDQETSEKTREVMMSVRANEVKLTVNDLQCPAYLINNNFEIDWINAEAEEMIFGQSVQSIKLAEGRNIFRLFIGIGLSQSVESRHPIIDFHIALFKQKSPKEELEKLYQGITKRDVQILSDIYDMIDPASPAIVPETYLNLNFHLDSDVVYRVNHIKFREGILCVYLPADTMMQGVVELLSRRGRIIQDLLKQRMPTLVSFTVLVADLQDSVRICAELPPDEYFQLVNQIWKCMEASFKKYYGTYGKHTGDGMVYYFLKDRDSNYLMNAVHCALELRESMKILSNEWKITKGWFNDLYLNVGINEGQEYFGTIPASPSIEFTALGDSVNHAGRLSDFARYGSVWTTKNLMTRLSDEERKTIRYGIRKKEQDREVMIDNIFSRVVDLMPDSPKFSKYMDIATLAVTEIRGIR